MVAILFLMDGTLPDKLVNKISYFKFTKTAAKNRYSKHKHTMGQYSMIHSQDIFTVTVAGLLCRLIKTYQSLHWFAPFARFENSCFFQPNLK